MKRNDRSQSYLRKEKEPKISKSLLLYYWGVYGWGQFHRVGNVRHWFFQIAGKPYICNFHASIPSTARIYNGHAVGITSPDTGGSRSGAANEVTSVHSHCPGACQDILRRASSCVIQFLSPGCSRYPGQPSFGENPLALWDLRCFELGS